MDHIYIVAEVVGKGLPIIPFAYPTFVLVERRLEETKNKIRQGASTATGPDHGGSRLTAVHETPPPPATAAEMNNNNLCFPDDLPYEVQSAPTSRKTSQSFHRSSYQSHAFPVPEAPVDLEKLVNLAKMEMEAEMERDESEKLERRGPAAAARKKSVRGYAGNNSRAHLRRRSSEDLYVKGEKESFFSRQNRLNRLCDRGGRGPWGRGEYWNYLPMDCGSGRGKK